MDYGEAFAGPSSERGQATRRSRFGVGTVAGVGVVAGDRDVQVVSVLGADAGAQRSV